jgi:DNA invertase Pin-like site-specific DNA recombinase
MNNKIHSDSFGNNVKDYFDYLREGFPMNEVKKVVIFSRVSSKLQCYNRQTSELLTYANQNGFRVVSIFEEVISGAKKNKDRQILNEMLEFIAQNQVSKVLIWELSRLGRNAAQVLETLDYLNQIKVSLYILNYNLETLNEDGVTVNPMSTFMVQVISSFAQVERENIIQRMRSGYAKHLQDGKSVGRKVGYRKSQETLLYENREVIKYLKKGYSVREVMALTKKSSGLVQKIKKMVC